MIGEGVTNATSSSFCGCGLNAEMSTETGRCECSAGYGGDATVAGVGCSPCGSGAYKENRGNTQCTSCPMGSAIANNVQNSTNGSDCACPVNSEKMMAVEYASAVLVMEVMQHSQMLVAVLAEWLPSNLLWATSSAPPVHRVQ